MGAPLARVGGAPLRRGGPGAGVRDRHAAADRVGVAARRARLQLHADGRPGAAPPDARQERLLPDGLGRQRPPDRAARPELLPRALRGPRALRAGPRPRDGRRRGPQAAAPPDLPRELHRALPRPHRRGREGLQGPVAAPRALGGLAARVLDDQRARAGASRSRASWTSTARGRSTRSRRRPCGTWTSRPRWRRPRSRTGRRRAPSTTCASGSRAAAASSSPRRAPSCFRPAWGWPRTPTTSATGRSSGSGR